MNTILKISITAAQNNQRKSAATAIYTTKQGIDTYQAYIQEEIRGQGLGHGVWGVFSQSAFIAITVMTGIAIAKCLEHPPPSF